MTVGETSPVPRLLSLPTTDLANVNTTHCPSPTTQRFLATSRAPALTSWRPAFAGFRVDDYPLPPTGSTTPATPIDVPGTPTVPSPPIRDQGTRLWCHVHFVQRQLRDDARVCRVALMAGASVLGGVLGGVLSALSGCRLMLASVDVPLAQGDGQGVSRGRPRRAVRGRAAPLSNLF